MTSPGAEKVEQFIRNVFRRGGRRPVPWMVAPILKSGPGFATA